jgi:hypothetical protein
MKGGRRTVRYTFCSCAPVAAVGAVCMWRFGGSGFLLAALLAVPWVAMRYDNDTGVFLPLAVLFLFVFAVLALLLLLMALVLSPR